MTWIEALSEDRLVTEAPILAMWKLGESGVGNLDDAATYYTNQGTILLASGDEDVAKKALERQSKLPAVKYWESFKAEFHEFVCTDSKKYEDVREQLNQKANHSHLILVSLITAAIAPHVGLAAGATVPFAAILLFALIKLGVNALCPLLIGSLPPEE